MKIVSGVSFLQPPGNWEVFQSLWLGFNIPIFTWKEVVAWMMMVTL